MKAGCAPAGNLALANFSSRHLLNETPSSRLAFFFVLLLGSTFGYPALREPGAGCFGGMTRAIQQGRSLAMALKGSIEEEQFHGDKMA